MEELSCDTNSHWASPRRDLPRHPDGAIDLWPTIRRTYCIGRMQGEWLARLRVMARSYPDERRDMIRKIGCSVVSRLGQQPRTLS